MKTLVFIPTASVDGDKPTPWFKQLLDAGINWFNNNKQDEVIFLISGRWNNVKTRYPISEAEVAQKYILEQLPNTKVLTEELAVETGGNFAFSKPFVTMVNPDKVVIINSAAKTERTKYLTSKIFGPDYNYEYIFVNDIFSDNPRAVSKEPKAIGMFKKLFDGIKDGDDKEAREILLYHSPFYNWDIMDNKEFFDKYWEGGFADFKEKRLSIDNK